jgi:phenylglyoxylate dehydrogenase epsilon subunit
MRPVIIGSSTAAIAAIEAIHLQNPEISPILISDESLPPYSPMALLPFAEKKIDENDLFFRDAEVYVRNNVEAKLGKKAVQIDVENRAVILEDGERVAFSNLLIAIGARPTLPHITGLHNAEVLTMRRLSDANFLQSKMSESKAACIIGAGLIGMEVAQCLLAHGILTSVIDLMPKVLNVYFDSDAASLIQCFFEARGARFYLGKNEISFESREGEEVTQVFINGEFAFNADLIIAATGVSPRLEIVEGSNIDVNEGILVDEKMETSIPGIYAAGDVTEAPDFFSDRKSLNRILPAAAEQGRIAGINMAGGDEQYSGNLKMNIFNFLGRRAFSIGTIEPEPGHQVIPIRQGIDQYGKILMNQGRLVGCVFVNMDLEPGIIKTMIESREVFSSTMERFSDDLRTFSRAWMIKRRMTSANLE